MLCQILAVDLSCQFERFQFKVWIYTQSFVGLLQRPLNYYYQSPLLYFHPPPNYHSSLPAVTSFLFIILLFQIFHLYCLNLQRQCLTFSMSGISYFVISQTFIIQILNRLMISFYWFSNIFHLFANWIVNLKRKLQLVPSYEERL